MVFADAVMVVDAVSPLNADDDVLSVIAGPVWSAPTGPSEVMAAVSPASVPQVMVPVESDLRSQFAAFRAETIRFVVEAIDEVMLVVDAYGVVTAEPRDVTSEVPLKYTEFPVVVNDDALVPPRAMERIPVVSPIAIPSDEVANCIQVLPGPPIRSEDEAMVAIPVPPFPPGSVPVTSAARLMSEVPTTPAVALRKPESAPIVSELETI